MQWTLIYTSENPILRHRIVLYLFAIYEDDFPLCQKPLELSDSINSSRLLPSLQSGSCQKHIYPTSYKNLVRPWPPIWFLWKKWVWWKQGFGENMFLGEIMEFGENMVLMKSWFWRKHSFGWKTFFLLIT